MCQKCAAEIVALLAQRTDYQTADRRRFKIEKVEGDGVHIRGHTPTPAFHASHAGALLHWLREGHFICAVGSGTTSVKVLIGRGGKLAECSRCAQNASHVWSVLVTMPGVRRLHGTGLGPIPKAT